MACCALHCKHLIAMQAEHVCVDRSWGGTRLLPRPPPAVQPANTAAKLPGNPPVGSVSAVQGLAYATMDGKIGRIKRNKAAHPLPGKSMSRCWHGTSCLSIHLQGSSPSCPAPSLPILAKESFTEREGECDIGTQQQWQ